MIYVIMCGGEYKEFETPKQLSVINGEPIVMRTIRLLVNSGVNAKDIYISSNNPTFDHCGVERLENPENNFIEGIEGMWLDAFYPSFEEGTKVTYIFGDVYFKEEAIKTIVNYKTDKNILFGTSAAKNEFHENWGEPFAYIVNDYKTFMDGVKEVKELYKQGKTKRHPIVWELYRYLNNLDVNIQRVLNDTYVCIDDGTMDIDSKEELEELKNKL